MIAQLSENLQQAILEFELEAKERGFLGDFKSELDALSDRLIDFKNSNTICCGSEKTQKNACENEVGDSVTSSPEAVSSTPNL